MNIKHRIDKIIRKEREKPRALGEKTGEKNGGKKRRYAI
jgi:hypothetical protein